MRPTVNKLFISLFVLIILQPFFCHGSEVLRINTSIKPPFSTEQEDGFFDLLLRELFTRIGVQVDLVRLPAERALQMADEGLSDGDIPRISGLESLYPNLIKVGEPVIDYYFVAFGHKKEIPLELSWKKLAGKDVGFIIGWKIYENNVPKSANIIRASSPGQLFKLLDGNRINVALYERYAGKHLIESDNFKDLEECRPPLAVRPMYLYLNKKHKNLADALSKELKKMKVDGSWQRNASLTLEKPQ